jgi:hypothetical protein
MNRRDFLYKTTQLAGLTLILGGGAATRTISGQGESRDPGNGMLYRTLGRTGQKVSAIGLGGAHIGRQKDESESIAIIREAVDRGINYLDNSWDYSDGKSEIRMGKALRDGYRQKVFLMTKIDGRTRQSAARQIDESLKRLQTDHVDLVLGMKSMGDKIILKSGTVKPVECLHYALNLPTSVAITGIDRKEILDQAFEAARTFRPMTPEQTASLLARTKKAAMDGRYELFKTSTQFDSTAQHPEWLG